MSLRRLGLETIDLWQLHRIDAKVPREEQFGVMKELQDEGKVRHLGLSEVPVEDVKAAQQVFEVATVQNLYNLTNRQHEDVLDYCEQRGHRLHPVVPAGLRGSWPRPAGWSPRSPPRTTRRPGQVALAWLLPRSPVMLPIPGTGSVEHLEENVAAVDLELTAEELARLDEASAES